METVLDEIKRLVLTVESIKDEMNRLSDKFEGHMKICPSVPCQASTCRGELRSSCLQSQGHMDVDSKHDHKRNNIHRACYCHIQSATSVNHDHKHVQGHCQGKGDSNVVSRCHLCQGQGRSRLDTLTGSDEDYLNENEDDTEQTSNIEMSTRLEDDTEKTNEDKNPKHLLTVNKFQYERRSTIRRTQKERKRQCLRLAIQENILLLLDQVPFVRGDLLDRLIQENCLTDNECTEFIDTGVGSGKDKVRNMMRIIRRRSYEVMNTFLKCMEKDLPDVVEIIRKSYDKYMKDNKITKSCTFCLLKQSVDIKTVGDVTWSAHKITDSLYDEIVIGKHDTQVLWQKLAAECNALKDVKSVILNISKYLRQKGHYTELVNRLGKVNSLKCHCAGNQMEEYKTVRSGDGLLSETDSEDFSSLSPASSLKSSSILNVDSDCSVNDSLEMALPQYLMTQYSRIAHRFNRQNSFDINDDIRSRSNSCGKSYYENTLDIKTFGNPFSRRASMFV